MSGPSPVEAESDRAVRIRVKVVPGASADSVAGVLGDRLKVRVSAPAQGGRANEAVREALARTLGVRARDVEIVSGQTSPEKLIRVQGVDAARARAALGCP